MVPRGLPGVFSLVLLAATWLSMVCADLARTYPMSVTDWELESQMQLSITSEGSVIPIKYTVLPLTSDLGLNESQADRGVSANLSSPWTFGCSVDYLAHRSTRHSIR
jgi:hypothetical protein